MVIQNYNKNWVNQFISIKKILKANITGFISIEHVGSTSIPGMNAKPIIDIDIIIDNENQFENIKKQLENIGYHHVGNQGITGREVFKQEKNIINIKHHLYVCTKDNKELLQHIKFRDKLRESTELVNEYNRIKNEILERVGLDNRAGYVEMKEKEYKWFFEKIFNE